MEIELTEASKRPKMTVEDAVGRVFYHRKNGYTYFVSRLVGGASHREYAVTCLDGRFSFTKNREELEVCLAEFVEVVDAKLVGTKGA